MATVCRTAKEFAEAVKNNEEYIRGFGRMSGRVNGPGERDED